MNPDAPFKQAPALATPDFLRGMAPRPKRVFRSFALLIGAAGAFLATRPALSSAAVADEKPRLSIKISSNSTVTVEIAGASGRAHGLAATEDFQNWTHGPPRQTGADGITRLTISTATRHLFFRAFSFPPDSARLSAEAALGKRLFAETRFAQFFFARSGGNVNLPLSEGDPALEQTITMNLPVPGAFAGQSMSCRACHFFQEQKEVLGYRAYADFAIRSPIPDRGDGRKTTPRNSPALVNASIARPGKFFLHFDGEFPDGVSLVKGTLTGRNYGWLPNEYSVAVAHIARVVREDDGEAFPGNGAPGAYRALLKGTDLEIAPELRLPENFRIDVTAASDEQILETVAKLVDAFLRSLKFAVDASGEYAGSPYDLFLQKNSLPRQPAPGEDDKNYSRRLRALVNRLATPVFVTPADGAFKTHDQAFAFGPKELDGLKIFLAEPDAIASPAQGRVGNCASCHAPPHFTDFDFHNTGAAQWEYDSVHGEGAFARILIPSLTERLNSPNEFLPATSAHPNAKGFFAAIPSKNMPGQTDLGLWNLYANPDFPAPQPALRDLLSSRFGPQSAEELLSRTVAAFKTPGLRDLGHSAPYLHTGQSSNIESVIFFYRFTSELARAGRVRNADPELARIFLRATDSPALAAFLRSLNEDLQ